MTSTFAELGVPSDLVRALAARGVTEPFPVQAATIADQLAGRDVSGRAPTGSGKTLAFGIPLVTHVRRAAPKRPRALVLAPTRELAAQIDEELRHLTTARKRRSFALFGGVGYEPQRRALRRGVDIVVACPGRLADLIAQRALSLEDVTTVVVDEADRMADMGFLPEVRKLLDQTAPDRQTILFSATLDGDVAALVREYQNDPVRHEVGPAEPDVTSMRHEFLVVDPRERGAATEALVAEHGSTVVFCRTRYIVDRVLKQLQQAGVKAAPIHGGRTQGQRTRALEAFRNGKVDALVATDVAARGIHVDDVACVVHYDLPADAKDYIHRSGRTGRAGATGVVVSMVAPNLRKTARRLGREVGIEVRLTNGPARSGPATERTGAAQPTNRPKHAGSAAPARSDAPRKRSDRAPTDRATGDRAGRTSRSDHRSRSRTDATAGRNGRSRKPSGHRKGRTTR